MRLRRPDMDPRLAKAVVLVSSLVMVEEFGKDYELYMTRTKRLVPGVW